MELKNTEKQEHSVVALTIEITKAEFEAAKDKAFKKTGKNITVPGFRKGKAPRKMIEKLYGEGVFFEEAFNIIYPDAMEMAVEKSGIKPVGRADVDLGDPAEEGGLTIIAKVPVEPEVELGEYKGIEVEKETVKVLQADVKAELNRMAQRNARTETVERKAKKNDTVDIDFEGFVDGVPFEGGKAEHHELTLGSGAFIPGFERAGVHSGDSISIYPSINIEQKHKDTLVKYTEALAKNLAVLGLVNIQFVLYNDQIYVIEVNPRSSRTVPYISKVTGVPMVDLATRCMFGEKLKDMGCGTGLHPESDHYAVKVPVFSFQKLRDLDTQLGPEMKSTGEVLGVAKTFREALLKGLTGAGFQMKKKGAVLISVRDSDKQEAIRIGERFEALGFDIYATSGTANVLNRHMVATNSIRNVDEPSPNIIDLIESGKIDYVVATSVKGRHPELGSVHIRRTAVERAIPCLTSMDTVSALLRCLEGDVKIENCEMVDINTI